MAVKVNADAVKHGPAQTGHLEVRQKLDSMKAKLSFSAENCVCGLGLNICWGLGCAYMFVISRRLCLA